MQRLIPRLALLLGLAGTAVSAHANPVISLRGYFDTLGTVYPTQQPGNPWTFHAGNQDGGLIGALGQNYYGPETYQQIGSPVNVGTSGCSPGYCPADPSTLLATFDGVFLHPGSRNPTTAVYHVREDLQLDQLTLWTEMVGNGHYGNGLDVTVRLVIGGVEQDIASYTFEHASTLAARDERVYAPHLTLHDGDLVAVLFGNRGSYLYDHANVEIRLATSDPSDPGASVPEPAAAALVTLALAATRRRRRMP